MVYPKKFQGLHFLFSGDLMWSVEFELFANETNLEKKRSVKYKKVFYSDLWEDLFFCQTFPWMISSA